MNKLMDYLRKIDVGYWVSLTMIAVISATIFIPVQRINFGWIDDGADIITTKKLISSFQHLDVSGLSGILIEKYLGLFRPVHWLSKAFVYMFSGNSPQIQFFFHSLIIIGTSYLIFKIVKYFSKSNLGAFFAASLFLVIPINFENWVRLGPQEPLMGFFLTLTLYTWLVRKNVNMSLFFFLLALLTKVTVIAFVPSIVIYYLTLRICAKKNLQLSKLIFGSLVLSIIFLLISFSIRTGYATLYDFNPLNSLSRFRVILHVIVSSFPIGLIFLFTYFWRNSCPLIQRKLSKVDTQEIDHLFFLLLFLFFVMIQSPWTYILSRYLLPATIPLSIFLGVELGKITLNIGKIQYKFSWVVVFVFLTYFSLYLVTNIQKARGTVIWWVHYSQGLQSMFKYLAENTPPNGLIFLNFLKGEGTYEPILETGWNLDLFYNRGDIRVKSLEERTPSDNNYIVVSSPTYMGAWVFLNDSDITKMDNIVKVDSFSRSDNYLIFANGTTIFKQLVKKSLGIITGQQRPSFDGIISDYYLRDEWNFYFFR